MTAREYLDWLDALHAETTPGEWSLGVDDEPSYAVIMQAGGGEPVLVSSDGSPWLRDEDAEFIAASHAALPRLTAALRAVIDLCDIAGELADTDELRGYRNALLDIRTAIHDALTKETP